MLLMPSVLQTNIIISILRCRVGDTLDLQQSGGHIIMLLAAIASAVIQPSVLNFSKLQTLEAPVVRRVNSAIHWIIITIQRISAGKE